MRFKKPLAVLAFGAFFAVNATVASAQMTFFGEDTDGNEATPATLVNSPAAEADFLSFLIGVGTEDFESFADGTVSPLALSFPGAGTATLTGAGQVSEVLGGTNGVGRFAISGTKYWEVDAGGNFVINFSDPVAAFGFYGTDIGDFDGTVQLSFATAGGPDLVNIPHTVGGSGGSALFFGYINTENPFTSVAFLNTSGSGDFFGFDDMTIGSVEQVREQVPEPATVLLLGSGLLGIGIVARRRRNDGMEA